MRLPQLKKLNTKNTEVRGNTSTVTEAETCCNTASQKENYEERPNRTVAENKVLPKWKAGKQQNSVAQENDVRERG
jgi:hypothetical protein